jgi:hypothetical protein
MAAASTSTRTTKNASTKGEQRTTARRATDQKPVAKNEATEAKAAEKPAENGTPAPKKAVAARVTGLVKAERFANLAKELRWEAETSDVTADGAVVTVKRTVENGSEVLRAEWRENKLVIGSGLPTWKFTTKEGKEGASLVVHNIGEAKRIMAVEPEKAGPEAAATVRYDASLTNTQRRRLQNAEEATAE